MNSIGDRPSIYELHDTPVEDISIDVKGEYIASCAGGTVMVVMCIACCLLYSMLQNILRIGKVVILGIMTGEKLVHNYTRPVKTIALDPFYFSKNTRQIATGGVEGKVLLNQPGWFGVKDQVIDQGDGMISKMRWRGRFLAWANEAGIKVYLPSQGRGITAIERPKDTPDAKICPPNIVWEREGRLLVTWGNWVLVSRVRVLLLHTISIFIVIIIIRYDSVPMHQLEACSHHTTARSSSGSLTMMKYHGY